MRKHGVVNRFSNAASIGICVYFGMGEEARGNGEGAFDFYQAFVASSNPVSILLN